MSDVTRRNFVKTGALATAFFVSGTKTQKCWEQMIGLMSA